MKITLDGIKPYDGTYEIDFQFTTREQGWIKRFAGYLPTEYARASGDSEFACTLVAIALHRAARLDKSEVPDLLERLQDLRIEEVATFDVTGEPGEDDAGPPALSSNGNESTSGAGSATSSGTSAPSPAGSGTPGSAISGSAPATSAS